MHQRKDVDNIQALFPPLHYFLAEKVEIKKVVLELVYTFVGLVKYFGLAWRTPDKVATTY